MPFHIGEMPGAAIAEFKRAEKLDPTSAMSHYLIGAELSALHRVKEAISEYTLAIASDDPTSESGAHNLALGLHYNLWIPADKVKAPELSSAACQILASFGGEILSRMQEFKLRMSQIDSRLSSLDCPLITR